MLCLQNVTMSAQFMEQASRELRRIEMLSHLLHVREKGHSTPFLAILKKIDDLIEPHRAFTLDVESEVVALMKESEKYVGGLGITKKEQMQILSAMGIAKGHWYKCPNGHIYYIGECGGADQLSRCNECGASIGGGSHRLVAGNTHAGEMDGSAAPSWPM